MITYTSTPQSILQGKKRSISSFLDRSSKENIDWETVDSFGEEWERFSHFSQAEIDKVGEEYFDIVPQEIFNKKSSVLDVGCGTGRWTYYVFEHVGFVDAVDPSKAVFMADALLEKKENI